MSGHSKWSKIKRFKAVADKKKGALFSKLAREIMVAARAGKNMDMNPRLRKAVADAKSQALPKDNIERAIKKGCGEIDEGQVIEELTYEGHGPKGVAVLIQCITDNRNRTQPELRKIFERNGGGLFFNSF